MNCFKTAGFILIKCNKEPPLIGTTHTTVTAIHITQTAIHTLPTSCSGKGIVDKQQTMMCWNNLLTTHFSTFNFIKIAGMKATNEEVLSLRVPCSNCMKKTGKVGELIRIIKTEKGWNTLVEIQIFCDNNFLKTIGHLLAMFQ
jgi:hypothetical protein